MEVTMTNKPVKTLSIGAIRAAIWGHDTESGRRFYKVSVERRYFDSKAEEFGSTRSFSRDELPAVAKLLDDAYAAIFELQSADRSANDTQAH